MQPTSVWKTLAAGTAVFIAQILVNGSTGFFEVSPKVSSLASQAIAHVAASPNAWGWIAYYVALGILVHSLPLLLAQRIRSDLAKIGSPRPQTLMRQRGMVLVTGLLFLAPLAAWSWAIFPRRLMLTQPGWRDAAAYWAPAILSTLPALGLVALWLWHTRHRRAVFGLAALAVVAVSGSALQAREPPARNDPRPDIILLGVDSLRPDHLAANGGPVADARVLNGLLHSGVSFDHAYTPMGRTFVAYMSLLNGQYPVRHGVRENLWPRAMFEQKTALPHHLQSLGYSTVFGIDEVRFANLDSDFGFNRLVMPPPGAVELLAGTLTDSWGTNLLQLFPFFDRLLPHITGNRALTDRYAPHLQPRKLARAIHGSPENRPLFLAAHFCIAHVPFAYGRWHPHTLPPSFQDSPDDYRKALVIADQQLEATLEELRRGGRLRNAIVVVFSDHGEGLTMAKDTWRRLGAPFAASGDYGHGGNALALSQTRVFLVLQRFRNGKAVWPAHRTNAPASLVDLAPSVLMAAGLPALPERIDGISLLDRDGRVVAPSSRPIFVESGIFGRSLKTLQVDPNAVANEFSGLYRVTDDLRFELQASKIPHLMENKQRGMIVDGIGVATLPNGRRDGNCWLRVNYRLNEAECFAAPVRDPEVGRFARAICKQFQADEEFRRVWCSSTGMARDLRG